MNYTYRVFDFVLHANVPIPGLPPIRESTVRSGINIELGLWPERPKLSEFSGEPSYVSPYLDGSGEPMVRIWRIADRQTYRLAYINGLEFLVDPELGSIWAKWPDELSLEDAASYLLGPVLGIFLRLRGETCLHASAVAFKDRAVIFVGPPGAGKSTTAAALNSRGYAVLSDDVVLLREDQAGRFNVVPSHPSLSLWPESVDLLGLRAHTLPRVFPKFEKRRLPLLDSQGRFEPRTLPIGGLYILGGPSQDATPRVEPLPAQTALMSLIANTYATYVLDGARRSRELEVLGRLVSALPVRSILAPQDSNLDQFCNAICDDYHAVCGLPTQY